MVVQSKNKGSLIKAALSNQFMPEENEELIFTLDSKTGGLAKVEKVDRASGQLQELSEEEYASLYYAAHPYDPSGYQQAYYQGITDYAMALCCGIPGYGYSPEEDAYYQGMADYAAALGGTSTGYESSPKQAVTYRGMAESQGSSKE